MTRLLDLHIHPSLKMYYLPYLRSTFHSVVPSGAFWNPLSFRTRYGNLKKSPEKVMLCAHYVIERGFVSKGIKKPARLVSWTAAPLFFGRLCRQDPWEALHGMMDTLERSVANTNRWVSKQGVRMKLVRNYGELENLEENEIALIHAVEGAHGLGYGPQQGQTVEDFWKQTERRLTFLKERGVCLITLAHFWDNMFCPQTDGTEWIPRKNKRQIHQRRDDLIFQMKRANWKWGDPEYLSDRFARKVLELGILIDVSHCQEHARYAIYDLCEEYGRPVVASHVGLQHFFNHEYNLSDTEVRRIHRIGGVVGLILSRRWLVDPIKRWGSDGKGIDDLIENMRYIKDLVGDVSCIGIGTDFDGLTDPFKDCPTPDKLNNIAESMCRYFNDEEIDNILYCNGLRTLKKGWC